MSDKFWKTSISKVEPNHILVRGYDLIDLIGKISFGDIVYLLLKGDLPPKNEGKMVEAILTASCEHSLAAPSVAAARFVASSGVPLQACVAAGMIAIGDWHGGAMEELAKLLQETISQHSADNIENLAKNIIETLKSQKIRIPGYGHPYHNKDPRVTKLLNICDELGLSGKHVSLAKEIDKQLTSITKGKVSMNVDGVIAGIMSDMAIDWRLGRGFFIISRSVGLVAHAFEQMTKEKPFKAVLLSEIDYTGPTHRQI